MINVMPQISAKKEHKLVESTPDQQQHTDETEAEPPIESDTLLDAAATVATTAPAQAAEPAVESEPAAPEPSVSRSRKGKSLVIDVAVFMFVSLC